MIAQHFTTRQAYARNVKIDYIKNAIQNMIIIANTEKASGKIQPSDFR
jgi:hypothetical protein